MGEILDALRRADEERMHASRSRPVARSEPSHPPVPLRPARTLEGDSSPAPEVQPALPLRPSDVVEAAPLRIKVPRERSRGWPARAVVVEKAGPVAESYRHFAVRLRQAMASRRARTVVVTSSVRSEGKTTTSCNLALALASISGSGDRRIALVDLDLRQPAVAPAFGWQPSPGIDRVLLREVPLEAARVATDVKGLELFGVEQRRPNAHEILSQEALQVTLQELGARYDLVVVDSPPTLLVPDTALLLQHLPVFVAVARSGTTRMAAFRAMIEQLGRGKLVGSFMNEISQPRHLTNYGHYSYDDMAEVEKK